MLEATPKMALSPSSQTIIRAIQGFLIGMVYVVICPRCGMARASYKVEDVLCVFCGARFTAKPVWSGSPEEASEKVRELNARVEPRFRKLKRSPYLWRSLKKPVSVELSTIMAKILYLLEESSMTCSEIAYRLGEDKGRVQRALQSLRKLGYVECFKRSRHRLEDFQD